MGMAVRLIQFAETLCNAAGCVPRLAAAASTTYSSTVADDDQQRGAFPTVVRQEAMAEMLASWTSSVGARLLSSTGEAADSVTSTLDDSTHAEGEAHHDVRFFLERLPTPLHILVRHDVGLTLP